MIQQHDLHQDLVMSFFYCFLCIIDLFWDMLLNPLVVLSHLPRGQILYVIITLLQRRHHPMTEKLTFLIISVKQKQSDL